MPLSENLSGDLWYQFGFVIPLTSRFCLQYNPEIRRRSTEYKSSSETVRSVAIRRSLLAAVCFYRLQEILAYGFGFLLLESVAIRVKEDRPCVQRAPTPLDSR